MEKPLKILIKFPTRSRPEQFLKVLNLLNDKATDKENIYYLISTDSDDHTMTAEIRDKARSIIKKAENLQICIGVSNNKIHACNRDVDDWMKWDIVVLVSDDMIPQIDGWDEIIRQAMLKYYPDTDGCLWFNDGYQPRICTLSILGRKFYDSFGYIYCPDYNSLFCDEEFTNVAQGLDKMTYFTTVLFKHEHFVNNPQTKRDKLYDRNEAYFNIDKEIYEQRKAKGFPK